MLFLSKPLKFSFDSMFLDLDALPVRKRIKKVTRRFQYLVHIGMLCKLLSINISYYFDVLSQRSRVCNDDLVVQVRGLSGDVRDDCKSPFVLQELDNCLFIVLANYHIDLPATNLNKRVNIRSTYGNESATNNPVSKISPLI